MTTTDDKAAVQAIGHRTSISAGLLTIAFAITLTFDYNSDTGIDFFVCFLLPFAYLFMVLANSILINTAGNRITSAFYADAAVVAAIIYACYICALYYSQLTFVRKAQADPIALSVVGYKPGNVIFALDILGYTLHSLSTIFVALSLEDQKHKILRNILHFHGII